MINGRLITVNLITNNHVIPLNEFTQNYIGNILLSIAHSFGYSPEQIIAIVDEAGLKITTEKGEIPLIKEFSKSLVGSTIKGMISPLKGIIWFKNIIITANYNNS